MQIFWDLDGCIRDLAAPLHGGASPLSWSQPLPNGWDICAWINDNKEILALCPPTQYYCIARALPSISIISAQPEGWRPFTSAWIHKHFNMATTTVTYVDSGEEKLDLLGASDLLVEDYPLFSNYSQIILIDHPYNQGVVAPYKRVYDKCQLVRVLKEAHS